MVLIQMFLLFKRFLITRVSSSQPSQRMKFNTIFLWTLCFQRVGSDLSPFHGKWRGLTTNNTPSLPYFQIHPTTVYAIHDDAKVSMDVKSFQDKSTHIHLEMHNLRVHKAPLNLHLMDYRILRLVRLLMKHGLNLHVVSLTKSEITVRWVIGDPHPLETGEVHLQRTADNDDDDMTTTCT